MTQRRGKSIDEEKPKYLENTERNWDKTRKVEKSESLSQSLRERCTFWEKLKRVSDYRNLSRGSCNDEQEPRRCTDGNTWTDGNMRNL